ncbi:MAG: PadR family transcriptional regulator [Anaerolineae bacterium]
MSLEHAILGFLRYKPLSGYELKKVFDASVRHFWAADQSQIYRTLARLTEQGLAEVEVVEQTDRPDRKVYHITEAGRGELARWLRQPPAVEPPRSAPLIQVFFAGQMSDEEILAFFRRGVAMMRGLLESYDRVPEASRPYLEMAGSAREMTFWLLTLELGRKVAQAQLEWMESVIERLEKGQVPQA